MALKRKTRNLPNLNDADKRNQMSFFDPVYQNDDESDGELSMNSSSRQTFQDESNETLNANPTTQTENDETLDDDSLEISATRIFARIKQIQSSIQQAQTMLDSMERFKHLVPGSDDQCEKLRVIISNLEEQQAGYMNLFNLITLTNEERSELMNKMSSTDGLAPAYNNEQLNDDDDNDDDDEEEEEKNANKPPTQRKVQFPTCPRVESKTGLKPSTSLNQPQMNSSDNEQNTRNDNSNYDSLVGSLKSDTLNWKDQQSTSGDEGSDVENDKELERNLMLQKEQLRALQGQKRALLALKKRSEKRLFEQQEQLLNQKSTNKKEEPKDDNLLSDINHLRDRLQLLRNLYEQKHDVEVQQIKNSTKVQAKPAENRAQNLEHVRQQLNELEEIVNYYQLDLMDQPDEETTVYEEDQIQPDDVQRLKSLIIQQKQQTSSSQTNHNENTAKPLNKLSDELATKRLELEQAKFALNRLQQMVKTIEPDQPSSSVRSTPVPPSSNKQTKTNEQNLSSISTTKISPKSNEKTNSILTTNTYADAKMAAQHREIERLVESRQRLQSLKDQIASLHQSMTTPPIPLKTDLVDTTEVENQRPKSSYKNQANTSERRNTDDNNLQLYRFECESGDGEETDEDSDEEIQPRIKQGNFHAAEDIVAEHEQRLLSNKKSDQNDDLSAQMREICRCLSTFIQEQKSFNRHIEEHLTAATNNSSRASVPSVSNVGGSSGDALFNQLQQQVLTQGLIVNLNTAYREIAVLQSEINALQSENNRLTSSLSSYDSQYQHKARLNSRDNSKESLYSTERTRTVRPQVGPKLNEYVQPFDANLLTKYNQFENSSKTSFNSQSTGKRTAINFDKNQMEITPTKHERNGTFIADRLASPKPTYSNTKQISDEYEITSNQYRHSSKSVPSKSFIIRRRFITNDNEDSLIQSSSSNYDQRLQQNTFDDDDDEDEDDDDDDDDKDDDNESDDEKQKDNLSRTIFNTQLTGYLSSSAQEYDNVDIQTLNLQVKAIMVQLIPFMRLQINETFNHTLLNNIRDRLIFLFRRQPDTADLVSQFQDQFSESLEKIIDKYCGITIRDCAANLIRDIADVVFDELVKYKVIKDTTDNNQTTNNNNEQMIQSLTKQQDEYSNLYTLSSLESTQETSLNDDGENENKYQIELAESESRPLTLVGSDEEDNDSDQEESQDSELETAVSRQEINLNQNEITSSSESNSNGLGYVMVNCSTSNDTVNESVPEDDDKKTKTDNVLDS